MANHFTQQFVVEFAETDMAGIAHFSNLFRWMERCEHAFYRSLEGIDDVAVNFETGTGFPRVHAEADYQAPLCFGDEVEVSLEVQKLGKSSITYRFVFNKVEGGGQVVRVAVGNAKMARAA